MEISLMSIPGCLNANNLLPVISEIMSEELYIYIYM